MLALGALPHTHDFRLALASVFDLKGLMATLAAYDPASPISLFHFDSSFFEFLQN